jgi:hypothetical protein
MAIHDHLIPTGYRAATRKLILEAFAVPAAAIEVPANGGY